MVSYLIALDPTFSFPLLFERFSVCLSFVYLEIMFGSHRSLLARHIGPFLGCCCFVCFFFLLLFCFVVVVVLFVCLFVCFVLFCFGLGFF